MSVRNDLCSGCGRWHDQTGESLLGWSDWHGKFWPLPRGHMPSNWPFDDLGGRRYGFCVMTRVAALQQIQSSKGENDA